MLDINPLLLSITIVVFLILIAVLNSLLFKPLFNYMKERDASIKNDLDKVGNNDDEIAELRAEAQNIVNEAKLEAAALREKVIAEAKELAESKIEAKRAELAKDRAEFEKSLAQSRDNLKNSLLSQLPLYKEAVKAKFSQI
ncbi:MAG: FoF1 ATP synthase subunit B' [Thiovulaceae bacterium]|nr:FoF1 ATP synthase subunit B' [Sulfurimonadaceae bacterium]